MSALTPLALQNADVLRALDGAGTGTVTALARDLGRDESNLRKTLKALHGALLIDRADAAAGLTPAGAAARDALDRAEGDAAPAGYRTLPHAQLAPDPANPRKTFDLDDEASLADAILEAGRIQQNLTVRPPAEPGGPFRIVSGERRWRAVGRLIAQGDVGPDYPLPCAVRELDDAAALTEAVMENLARRDLPPLEEAQAFRRLIDTHGLKTTDIARRVGRTQRHVQIRLQVLEGLGPEGVAQLEAGAMTWDQARTAVQTPKVAPVEPEPQAEESFMAMPGSASLSTSHPERGDGPGAEYTPLGLLRLVEVREKYNREGSGFFPGAVDVTSKIYLDRDWGGLVKIGAATTVSANGRFGASVTSKGCAVLAAAQIAPEANPNAVGGMRIAGGVTPAEFARLEQTGRWATPWLNLDPSSADVVQAPDPESEPLSPPAPEGSSATPLAPARPSAGVEPGGGDDWDDENDAAEDERARLLLQTVRSVISKGCDEEAFRDLLRLAGLTHPFRANSVVAGVVTQSAGDTLATCDVDRNLPDAEAIACAELIAFALNAACGHSPNMGS